MNTQTDTKKDFDLQLITLKIELAKPFVDFRTVPPIFRLQIHNRANLYEHDLQPSETPIQ
jgi:hypothetical protein